MIINLHSVILTWCLTITTLSCSLRLSGIFINILFLLLTKVRKRIQQFNMIYNSSKKMFILFFKFKYAVLTMFKYTTPPKYTYVHYVKYTVYLIIYIIIFIFNLFNLILICKRLHALDSEIKYDLFMHNSSAVRLLLPSACHEKYYVWKT